MLCKVLIRKDVEVPENLDQLHEIFIEVEKLKQKLSHKIITQHTIPVKNYNNISVT